MANTEKKRRPVTVNTLQKKKRQGEKITMLTCYDATFARLLDASDVDMFLVGDSLGMVIQGNENTLTVTTEEIAYHVKSVKRGTQYAHIVGDMPFLSWQTSVRDALIAAGSLLKAGANSVKLEGGKEACEVVSALVAAGIPVMGHVGLKPQSVHAMGGFRVQGKTEESAQRIFDDALALEEAGVFSIVLEGIPSSLAKRISDALTVPTIGIGAGPSCDGQVLVLYDLLGLDLSFKPKFVKRYGEGTKLVKNACSAFIEEVKSGAFPDEAHSFGDAKKPVKVAEDSKQTNDVSTKSYGPVDVPLEAA